MPRFTGRWRTITIRAAELQTPKRILSEYMKGGKVNESLQVLDDMIKKNPKDAASYGMKGDLYQTQGKIEDAKQAYTQSLKLNPDAPVPANNLAYILSEEGKDLQAAL